MQASWQKKLESLSEEMENFNEEPDIKENQMGILELTSIIEIKSSMGHMQQQNRMDKWLMTLEKKKVNRASGSCGILMKSNTHIIGVPERIREWVWQSIQRRIVEMSPNVAEGINPHFETLSKLHKGKHSRRKTKHMIIKLLKTKDQK